MRVRTRGIALLLAAGVAGAAAAVAVASAGGTAGAATTPQTVTLGSAIGNPTANICLADINCTYLPFDGVEAPALQAPFDGTVTSFSVNSGSAGDLVELRVLQPSGGGGFTGAGTSPAEMLGIGPTTFTVSLSVRAGDILGLDNSDSALMFDATPPAITAYYELPALADGATATPNNNLTGDRLLLSAVVVQQTSTGTGTSSTSTTSTTTTTVTPTAPTITGLRQARRTWREGNRPVAIASAATGTVFVFNLNAAARVKVTFTGRVARRRVGGQLSVAGHAGANAVGFDGRLGRHLLPLGRYSARFSASNAHGQSTPVVLNFTIVG